MVLVSFKKIFITTMVLIILLLWAENILLVHKQTSTSSQVVVPTSSNLRSTALSEKQPLMSKSKRLSVPMINQYSPPRLYNGCEVTSLAMILNYHGYHVTKNKLAKEIKTVPLTYANGFKGNPNVGFVGNMAAGPGLGVNNGPIYALARKYVGNKAINLTNHPFAEILKKVSEGEPVWVISTSTFAPISDFEQWRTSQGTIKVTFLEHSAVITGYDEHFIYVNNPYGYKNQKLNRSTFEKAWVQMGRQAIVIQKKS